MSMAINRISASGVAAMLYPVVKPTRVAKVDTGRAATATSSQAVQGTSRPQSADTSSTAEQVHTGFQYALAALSSLATGTSSVAGPGDVQSGVQQGSAYAQVEQAAGQTLDLTA